jgi:hypothetical protein
MALLLTLGAIVFVLVALVLVALAPPLLEALGLPGWLHWLLSLGRWVVVALVVSAALAVVYRLAPSRDAPQMRWVSIGAVVATVLWLVASIGFSIYADTFGSYGETYGSVAGAAVLTVAVDHRVHRVARCRDQRRERGADWARHHRRPRAAAGAAESGQGGLAATRQSRPPERLRWHVAAEAGEALNSSYRRAFTAGHSSPVRRKDRSRSPASTSEATVTTAVATSA